MNELRSGLDPPGIHFQSPQPGRCCLSLSILQYGIPGWGFFNFCQSAEVYSITGSILRLLDRSAAVFSGTASGFFSVKWREQRTGQLLLMSCTCILHWCPFQARALVAVVSHPVNLLVVPFSLVPHWQQCRLWLQPEVLP